MGVGCSHGSLTWSDDLFRLYGLEPRELRPTYHGFIERVHPDDRRRVQLIVGQALRDGRPFDFEHRLMRPDGTVVTLLARFLIYLPLIAMGLIALTFVILKVSRAHEVEAGVVGGDSVVRRSGGEDALSPWGGVFEKH